MLNYPDRFPAIHNANDCRWCWEEPLASDSFQLAKGLESAANSIQHEAGHCHQSYSCLEAAHRLKETVRILSSDAPSYEQLNAIQKLHSSKCGECDGTGRVGDLGPGGIYRNGKQVNNESARCDDCGGTGISWQNVNMEAPNT